MKRFIISLIAVFAFAAAANSQSVFFWTNDGDAVPIRIYVDETYIGDITMAYPELPYPAQEGCLNVALTPGKHKLTAINRFGQIYDGWNGNIRPKTDRVNIVQLYAGSFKTISRSDPDFDFVGWSYLFFDPVPPHYHHHHTNFYPDEINPYDDKALLIAMAATAVAGTALMTTVAVRNWSYPDARFPYMSVGVGTEYLFGLRTWRHVGRARLRIGNLGGLSLMADAGICMPNSDSSIMCGDNGFGLEPRNDHPFTWSVGAGLDYGGFCFGLRYKAPTDGSRDTFLVADCIYDWWFDQYIGLNFHAGFGVSGYGRADNLLDSFEAPLGMGLMVKF